MILLFGVLCNDPKQTEELYRSLFLNWADCWALRINILHADPDRALIIEGALRRIASIVVLYKKLQTRGKLVEFITDYIDDCANRMHAYMHMNTNW